MAMLHGKLEVNVGAVRTDEAWFVGRRQSAREGAPDTSFRLLGVHRHWIEVRMYQTLNVPGTVMAFSTDIRRGGSEGECWQGKCRGVGHEATPT